MIKKVVVITGGGSGLVFASAYELGKSGYTVLISGTNKEELCDAEEKLKAEEIDCYCAICNISKSSDIYYL